jgi:hypothetical protein
MFFDRWQFNQRVTCFIYVTEVIFLRYGYQITLRAVTPGVEWARENIAFAAAFSLDDGATMTTGIDKRVKLTVPVTGAQNRFAQFITGKKTIRFR